MQRRVKPARRRAMLATVLLLALAGCSGSGPPGATAAAPIPANPYPSGDPRAIAAGRVLYVANACAACHGAAGEGGMCPALADDVWAWGGEDVALYALIRDGSAGLRASGRERNPTVAASGDMPAFGTKLDSAEIWQLVALVRSLHDPPQ